MIKVYQFNNDSMCEDLLGAGVKEENLNQTVDNILSMLRLGKLIEYNGNFIVGSLSAMILKESYGIDTIEEELI